MSKERITVRLDPNQMMVLNELSEALESPISLLVRSIILDFLQRNEDSLYNLIDKKNTEKNAKNQLTEEKG